MCGRFTLRATPEEVASHFRLLQVPDFSPRYNIGPGQMVGVVRAQRADSDAGEPIAETNTDFRKQITHAGSGDVEPAVRLEWAWVKWGLVPHWAEDPAVGNRLINARAETVGTKPAFRTAARYRRCLVPADGFYEWKASPKGKQPYFIRLRGDRLFALAGLWDQWHSPTGEILETCTVLTVEPNPLVAKFHNRMPLILPPEAYDLWLNPAIIQFDKLREWIRPYPAHEMEAVAVSSYVNSTRHEGPRCIEPVTESGTLFDGDSS
ncbi:MAG: SOS response-associated peptidase [Thermogutta sp.]|uniref:SOS response-associated peptidase n=1 Tax=Thermogutta sp. TaxID=1962930 RepID=UPI0019BFD864|nr:SOS response-associated peptidase [Thermogutta sp.]MBC7352621.1 SOS response-associated peptidase [Thermogutta sp.]